MRKTNVVGAFVAAGLLACAVGAQAQESGRTAKAIRWAPSFKAAMDTAKASGKLVMADFYTEWWGYCKLLDKNTYTDARVIRETEQVVPVKLDAEKEGKETAKKYGVRGYPTILFINDAGEVEGKIGGYMPPEGFAPEVKKFTALHRELPKAEEKYKSGDRSIGTLTTLILGYTGRDKGDKAEELLPEAEKAADGKVTPDLAKAYNAVGDYHQSAERFDKAIGYFRKATQGSDADQTTYAKISIAVCYLSQQNLDEGAKELRELVAMPNATPAYKEQAQQMLKQVEAAQKQKKPERPEKP